MTDPINPRYGASDGGGAIETCEERRGAALPWPKGRE